MDNVLAQLDEYNIYSRPVFSSSLLERHWGATRDWMLLLEDQEKI
jgi:hypothetical protein